MPSPIPAILKQIRVEKGITLAELGVWMDAAPSTISDWENNRHEPILSSLEKWASALGYELELMLKEPANV